MNDEKRVADSESVAQRNREFSGNSWITVILGAVAVGLLIPLGTVFLPAEVPVVADNIPIPPDSTTLQWDKETVQPIVKVSAQDLPIATIVSGLSKQTYQRDVRITNVQIVDLDGDGKQEYWHATALPMRSSFIAIKAPTNGKPR